MPVATPDEIKEWLEWAGSQLLALQVRNVRPGGYRSFWPDYADESLAYGYTRETMRAAPPSQYDIPIMDGILRLPAAHIADPLIRQIVHKRALVTPLGQRYVWPYQRLAKALNLDRRLCARLFAKGISSICVGASRQQAHTFRTFLRPAQTET